MNTNEETMTMAGLADEAADLAARAAGCGLARLIERYVPARLAEHFAMRLAVALLREVRAHDAKAARPAPSPRH